MSFHFYNFTFPRINSVFWRVGGIVRFYNANIMIGSLTNFDFVNHLDFYFFLQLHTSAIMSITL